MLAVAIFGVFLIAFMHGAFGGGFAIIGIPLLSLAMDPITAGAVLAPLFIAMSFCALWYWRPQTWSRPDLIALVPALIAEAAVGRCTRVPLSPRARSSHREALALPCET